MSMQYKRKSLFCPRAVAFSDCFVVLVAFLFEQRSTYGKIHIDNVVYCESQ